MPKRASNFLTNFAKKYSNLKNTLAHLLAFDYLGALIASIVFPLVIFPYFGGLKTSFLIGMLNMMVALFLILEFKDHLKKFKIYREFISTLFSDYYRPI